MVKLLQAALIFMGVILACPGILGYVVAAESEASGPIKVFILAGDENVLEQGAIDGDRPGTLEKVVAATPRFATLKDKDGRWVTRQDVLLYDAHPLHNNTESSAKPLDVGVRIGGPEPGYRMSASLMLGHRLGDAFEQPVLIVRYGTHHPIWFKRGARTLGHDFRPPAGDGGPAVDGGWDVIHFNFGVWDATYREANSPYFSGHHTTSVEDFEKNLRTLVAKLKKTGATLVWGSVTPVWEGEAGKLNGDEDAYNAVAQKVMRENDVIVNDLNAEVRRQGFPKSNNVHSVGQLAPQVTRVLLDALAGRKPPTDRLPRVLLIGDSITGSYQQQVFKNLDGKASVFKNPGNAEDTWNGLDRMDAWLDLKNYLLNGQEYTELVDAIRHTLGDELVRICPAYSSRGAELAGLFWFQGVADSESEYMAAEYEQNLANLIRHLRKDLKAPDLPVVVAALPGRGEKMNSPEQKVFEAQMAVSNAKRYPEFSGNVLSIDTRPMRRPAAECPGGRDRYAGNAQSYLEVGDSMAEAMLKMLPRKP